MSSGLTAAASADALAAGTKPAAKTLAVAKPSRSASKQSTGSAGSGARRPSKTSSGTPKEQRIPSKSSAGSRRSVSTTRSTSSLVSKSSLSREDGYEARKALLAIVKAHPVIRDVLGLPPSATRLEVLHTLEKSDDAEFVLRQANLQTRAVNEALDLLAVTDLAPQPLKRMCSWKRVRFYLSAVLLLLGIGLVVAGAVAIPLSKGGYNLGSCKIGSYTNGTCVGENCLLDLFVYRADGEVRMKREFFPRQVTDYFSPLGYTWASANFRCCPEICCSMFDLDTREYCDQWSYKKQDGTTCPSGNWPCLYRGVTKKGKEELIAEVKEYQEPASTSYFVWGAILIVLGCVECIRVFFCIGLMRKLEQLKEASDSIDAPDRGQSPKAAWGEPPPPAEPV